MEVDKAQKEVNNWGQTYLKEGFDGRKTVMEWLFHEISGGCRVKGDMHQKEGRRGTRQG